MASYKELSDQVKELGTKLGAKTKPNIPPDALSDSMTKIQEVMARLRPYFPPTTEDKARAKSHTLTAQIVNFTTMDAARKKFFNSEYFKEKFLALPEDRKTVAATIPKSAAAIRDTIILYHCWKGNEDAIPRLWKEIETDYKNSPDVARMNGAKEFLGELLDEESVSAIASRLEGHYPTVAALKDFAKLTKLSIPPQSRAKKVPKKTEYERLAETIYAQGGTVRMTLD